MASAEGFHAGPEFDDKIEKLKRNMMDCEIKRMALETKLSQCSSSSAHLNYLKYVKLQHSLRELCEKEKKAHLRNQAFLQEFYGIETCLHTLMTNSRPSPRTKMLQVSQQAEINTSADMSRRSYHPATIFMGRQMSANSSIEHCLTQRKSPRPTKSFSISDPHSARQAAINSNLTDSCVVPANSDTQCLNKPDKIDVETSSFQISQKMPVTFIAATEDAGTHRAEIDKTQSGRKHLVESKQSAQLSTQTLERLSPENRTGDLQNDSPGNKVEDSLMYERLVPNEERFTHTSPSGSPPDGRDYINKQTSDNRSACENLSGCHTVSKQEENDFSNTSSDLTVSISDSEEMGAADLLDAIYGKEDKPTLVPKAKHEAVKETNQNLSSKHFPNTPEHNSYGDSSSASTISQNNLSCKGFIHLLQSIEGILLQMEPNDLQLYQDTGLSRRKRDHLVSLCNQMKSLRTEDLKACSALVIWQLQVDCGGSLQEENDHNLSKDEKSQRTISTLLQEHLLGHISFLKDRGILKGGVPAGFANVLMLHDEMKSQQGNPHTTRDESNLTSVSSPAAEICCFPKKDQTVDELCNRTVHESKETKQDDTNPCDDDSRIRKFGEKKGVTENASIVLQGRRVHTEKDDNEELSDISDIELPGLTSGNTNLRRVTGDNLSSEGTLSSYEPSPVHRKENEISMPTNMMSTKGPTHIKSKAFWGESEDSSSDIEAILRPPTHNVDGDDFDDFFD
ncbi:centrosomal protein kizuna [Mixophyes fleayi]|uniref:centrosomal protein kizuna n=1 Tax=Mixophyes fleayi TaxID=3061075 RepID=UPI003F4DD968